MEFTISGKAKYFSEVRISVKKLVSTMKSNTGMNQIMVRFSASKILLSNWEKVEKKRVGLQ
jgi:hypothetical protein